MDLAFGENSPYHTSQGRHHPSLELAAIRKPDLSFLLLLLGLGDYTAPVYLILFADPLILQDTVAGLEAPICFGALQ